MSKSLPRSRLAGTYRDTEKSSHSLETPAASAFELIQDPAMSRRSSDSMQSQFRRLSRRWPPLLVWKHAGESRNSGVDRQPCGRHLGRCVVSYFQRGFLEAGLLELSLQT